MKQEELLTFLLGRLHFDKLTKVRIYHLIKNDIDWYEFLNICVRRKLICLAYKNLLNLNLIQSLPTIIINNMQYHYKNNLEQNKAFIQVVNPVNFYFMQNDILAVPVKGLQFLHTIYKEDPGVRILSDIDFLASHTKKNDIDSFMRKSGYQIYLINDRDAFYSVDSNIQSCFYIKFENNNCYSRLKIDFDFSYPDFWIEKIRFSDDPIYTFMYLCKTYYMNTYEKPEPYILPQYNYEKLIDIHEYYIKFLSPLSIDKILDIANNLHIREEVLYTINCLKDLYTDSFA